MTDGLDRVYKGSEMLQEQSNLWAKSYINDGYLMLPELITLERMRSIESRNVKNLSW